MSKLIHVEGVPGRVAYSAPSGGEIIPVGEARTYQESKWLSDRLNDGDIIVSKKKPKN